MPPFYKEPHPPRPVIQHHSVQGQALRECLCADVLSLQ